jgi:hypothetical protein
MAEFVRTPSGSVGDSPKAAISDDNSIMVRVFIPDQNLQVTRVFSVRRRRGWGNRVYGCCSCHFHLENLIEMLLFIALNLYFFSACKVGHEDARRIFCHVIAHHSDPYERKLI